MEASDGSRAARCRTPSRLVESTSRHCSSDMRIARPSRVTPAFATSDFDRPELGDGGLFHSVVHLHGVGDVNGVRRRAHPFGARSPNARKPAITVSPSATKCSAHGGADAAAGAGDDDVTAHRSIS